MNARKLIDPKQSQLRLFDPVEDTAGPPGGAVLSSCGLYRYALWRFWEGSHQTDAHRAVVFIGLNPSTADASQDDPTIRRCRRFAREWGYPGMIMLNLFAYRATDPGMMKAFSRGGGDVVGPENDQILQHYNQQILCSTKPFTQNEPGRSGLVVFAWGVDGEFMGRGAAVAAMFNEGHCLGKTKMGLPRHPLFVPARQRPERV